MGAAAKMNPPKVTLSMSTVWATHDLTDRDRPDAADILARLAATGIGSVELEYRISLALARELSRLLPTRGLSVSSVHNFFPLPPDRPQSAASGDLFNLAALDREERAEAVRRTLTTLEWASDLEAGAVVLHLGAVDTARDKTVTTGAVAAGGMTPELEANLELRRQSATAHLDAVSFSLEALLGRAPGLGVVLGLENRFHAFQIPDLAEAEVLMARFAGGPVGYWHDVGHGVCQEMAGLGPAAAWLERFGDKLVGCHIHDVKDGKDHNLPGDGDLDWEAVTASLAHAPRKVLEVRPGPSPETMGATAEWLRDMFNNALRK